MNKSNLFISLLSLITLLTGCFDETKSLVVFDEIGIKKSALGIYSNNQNNTQKLLSLCYKNSQYTAHYIIKDGDEEGYLQGNFVPSKVDNTRDFYILSFPNIDGYIYNKDKKTKSKENRQNSIFYSKIENTSLLIWLNFLSGEDEKKSTSAIKHIISKSYSKTFIQKPIKFSKIGECSSVNSILSKIKTMKNKYSNFKEE